MDRNPHGNRSMAVMAARATPIDSLDLFCTPPWATRAFLHEVLHRMSADPTDRVWEPASGLGHMSEVLREHFSSVWATDVFDYGYQDAIGSFVGEGPDVIQPRDGKVEWIITNPPFNEAKNFVLRAIHLATKGVAVLVRSNWSEGKDRYLDLFAKHRPALIIQYAERVPMVKGRWDHEASTATAYAWFIWPCTKSWPLHYEHTEFDWILPGAKQRQFMVTDIQKFASRGVLTTLDEGMHK